jgi:hypothetical protein
MGHDDALGRAEPTPSAEAMTGPESASAARDPGSNAGSNPGSNPGSDGGSPADFDPGWATVAVLLITLALALWSVPHHVQAGDAGEFATIMLAGGVPHPSGYPWMRVLGLLARAGWALGLPPAIAAALPPALAGVAAWAVTQRSCASSGRPWLGACLVILAAASPLAIIHVNDSEVWGPHLLFVALFIHAVLRLARAREVPGQHALALGLALGLAVSHHLSAVLLVPLAIAAASPERGDRAWTPWARALVRNGALGLLGSLLGLSMYASLALGRGDGWRWGDVGSLPGWFAHVTRAEYGTFSLSLHTDEVAASATIGRALASLAELFSAGLLASPLLGAGLLGAALAGTLALVPSLGRARAIGWALSLLAAALGFPAMHNIDPSGPFGAWILERFDLLPALLMIVPLVAGLGWVGDRVRARLQVRPRLLIVGAGAIAAALLLAQLGAVMDSGRPRTEAGVELAALDLLATPDPAGPSVPDSEIRAIVFGTDDHRSFPVLYAQAVLGASPHTLYIDAQLLAHPWYRARLRARLPSLPDVAKPLALIGAIWSDPELDQVPIYLANVFSAPADRLTKVPEGMLWRIPPPADHPRFEAAQWTPEAIAARHLAAFARYRIARDDFAGLEHPRRHPWSADLWHAYVDTSLALASMLARAGHERDAARVLAALHARTGAPAATAATASSPR